MSGAIICRPFGAGIGLGGCLFSQTNLCELYFCGVRRANAKIKIFASRISNSHLSQKMRKMGHPVCLFLGSFSKVYFCADHRCWTRNQNLHGFDCGGNSCWCRWRCVLAWDPSSGGERPPQDDSVLLERLISSGTCFLFYWTYPGLTSGAILFRPFGTGVGWCPCASLRRATSWQTLFLRRLHGAGMRSQNPHPSRKVRD